MEQTLNVFSLANYALKFIEKNSTNLKGAEVYFDFSKYLNIDIEENSIKNSEQGSDGGVSVRLINQKGSLGFSFTNRLKKKNIEKIIKIALKMMKSGTEDPDFKSLPLSNGNYIHVKNLFDKNIKHITIEEAVEYVEDLIRICNEDDLAISQSANFTSSYSKCYIFNSNDLNVHGKDTGCSISSNVIVKDKISKDSSFGFEHQTERCLKKLQAEQIIRTALDNAKRNLNRKKVKSMKTPLILTPNGTISFILKPIASAINAESFQHKRSFLVDRRGEIIGSEFLNIEDNALIDGAVGSAIFDGEGIPCKNKKIIEKGKFLESGLLHNSYTAGKDGVESTGNASRHSYSTVPSIGITNFLLAPGTIPKSEIIEDIKEGILVDYTGDRPNISTGDFSGLIMQGNLIENGEIKEPLNETMFGINLIDLFKKIEFVSKDYKTYGVFRAPFVKISEVSIIGSLT